MLAQIISTMATRIQSTTVTAIQRTMVTVILRTIITVRRSRTATVITGIAMTSRPDHILPFMCIEVVFADLLRVASLAAVH